MGNKLGRDDCKMLSIVQEEEVTIQINVSTCQGYFVEMPLFLIFLIFQRLENAKHQEKVVDDRVVIKEEPIPTSMGIFQQYE